MPVTTHPKTIVCRVCNKRKHYLKFVVCNGSYTRKRTCLECHGSQTRNWRLNNPEKSRKATRNYKRRIRYAEIGISEEGYQELLRWQAFRCAICKQKPKRGIRLAVDHDHKTGKVRGLLCKHCNQALGHFRDDPVRLENAIDYLTAQVTLS